MVRQDPADGKAPQGSAVDLWISKGHAPVAVPAVVGKTQQAAEKALRAAGFTPVVKTAFSNDIDRGDVISVDPPEADDDRLRQPGHDPRLPGPRDLPVPTLTGLSPAAAEAKAKEYGLEVSFFDVPGTAAHDRDQPDPDRRHDRAAGDTITLYVA